MADVPAQRHCFVSCSNVTGCSVVLKARVDRCFHHSWEKMYQLPVRAAFTLRPFLIA